MSSTSTNSELWWSPGDALDPGARMQLEIPSTHPWMEWLKQYADESQDNGGLMRHGVLSVSLGGIEQRYDLLDVTMNGDRRSVTFTASWRMYGNPT